MEVICYMKGCSNKYYFELFLKARCDALQTKFHSSQTPPSHYFANKFANIWRKKYIKPNIWKIYQTKYSFQNVDTFASSRGKIIIFRSKMKRKWIFTFQNDKNVHWHGKDHCAMLIILDYLTTINFKMGAIWPVEILLSTLSWDIWPGDTW